MKKGRNLLVTALMVAGAVIILPLTLIWLGTKIIASVGSPSKGGSARSRGTLNPEEGEALGPDADGATRTLGSGVTGAHEAGAAHITGGAEVSATQVPPAWVIFRSGARAGQSIPLNSGTTVIGRAPDNDVVLDDATVSRHHARISPQNGTYVLEDAGSSSGTLVEGTTTEHTELMSGTSIKIGETEMVFMQSESAVAPGMTGTGGLVAGQPGETIVVEQPGGAMAWLAFTEGPDKGKTAQLRSEETNIGRDRENDVVVADAGVSRRHALIKQQKGKFVLLDLGSSGGTKVNGRAVVGKTLPTGGVLSIGQTQMVLVDVAPQQASPPATPDAATMVAQPAAAEAVMVVQSGPDAGKSFPVAPGGTTIGRDPECQVVLTDPAASRVHALVRGQGKSCVVYDLGSKGGTRIDGKVVSGSVLSSGDVVSIGRTEMVLMQPEQSSR